MSLCARLTEQLASLLARLPEPDLRPEVAAQLDARCQALLLQAYDLGALEGTAEEMAQLHR